MGLLPEGPPAASDTGTAHSRSPCPPSRARPRPWERGTLLIVHHPSPPTPAQAPRCRAVHPGYSHPPTGPLLTWSAPGADRTCVVIRSLHAWDLMGARGLGFRGRRKSAGHLAESSQGPAQPHALVGRGRRRVGQAGLPRGTIASGLTPCIWPVMSSTKPWLGEGTQAPSSECPSAGTPRVTWAAHRQQALAEPMLV